MAVHLVISRSHYHGYDQIAHFMSEVERSHMVEAWTATQKFIKGDCALFYFTKIKSIVAIGFVASDTRQVTGPYKWTDWKGILTVCDYKPVWLLENPLRLGSEMANATLRKWHKKIPYRRSRELSPQISQAMLEEIVKLNPVMGAQIKRRLKSFKLRHNLSRDSMTSNQKFIEGGIREITQELVRRNPQLRAHAIAKYGYTCQVCEFDFGKFYGEIGEGYIEVHHLRPLSDRKRAYHVTVEEVRVVCANCHRMLHKNGKKPLSIELLKKALQREKKHS